MRWRKGMRFLNSTHSLSNVATARVVGVLLHFEFFGDFHGPRGNGSGAWRTLRWRREYRAYRDLMRKEGAVNFRNEEPVRFEDSAQFLRLGLMRTEEALEQSARMTQDARAAEPAAHRA